MQLSILTINKQKNMPQSILENPICGVCNNGLSPSRSAYDPPPEFSTLTDGFRGCLDHIFLSPNIWAEVLLDMYSEALILENKCAAPPETPNP